MANPLFNGSRGNANMMQNIVQMVQGARNRNPQVVINQLSQKNPQAAEQINQLLQSGKSPQQAAMEIMQQRGLDPQQMLNMLGFNGR